MNAIGQKMSVLTSDQLENEEALQIIREIDRSPEMSQRQLSSRLGISLGKVNFLINALIRKGFVKVENFKKSSNKIAYLYNLTPRGIEEKSRMTYLFLKRKMKEYEQLELEIRQLREEMRQSGASSEEQDQSCNIL
ncbi:MAG TPA: MarR family EPS-associated transcriptional regulator [Syntrophales bacterium]|nr:MarR family EPS-associated transcriptional regulator [Syntrophales bacterium]